MNIYEYIIYMFQNLIYFWPPNVFERDGNLEFTLLL